MIQLPAPWTWRLLQVLVTAALFALLWHAADGPSAASILAGAEVSWLALALAALTVQTILSALRWKVTAGQLGVSLGAGMALREYYLSQLVNQSLPGGVIGDAGRAYRARGQSGLLASGQAVAIERLAGQVAMFLTMSAAFVATFLVPEGLDWPRWLAIPVAIFVFTGLVLPLCLWIGTKFGGAAGRAASGIWRLLGKTLTERKVLWPQIALSFGTTVCNLAAFAFCARALGIELSIAATAALVPLILFTMLIPISVSGWGLREGAAAAILPLAGATASGALATSVAFGLIFMVSVLPGLFYVRLRSPAPALK